MSNKFVEHKGFNLVETNKEILDKWMKLDVFHKSIDEREGCPQFIFFEGPPSANGHPGIHHVLARAIKDTFNRYKTMNGFQVPRKAGWDTHGLPVELGVEKELGITKKDIDNKDSEKYISTEEYNHKCRENVMMFTAEWRKLTEEMGYFVDLDNPYITYDNKYIETLWWLLKQLYNKGLLFKGYTIQPYSPGAGTGLSSHELNQPGCYRDVKDLTVTAQFLIKDPKAEWTKWGKPYFVAWTTTPWTLPSNVALCVGPKIDYVAVETYNLYSGEPATLVMAENLVKSYLKADQECTEGELLPFDKEKKLCPWRIIDRMKGTELEGLHYAQLMPWVKPCEKVDDQAPAFVLDYAAAHADKVFASEDGRDKFVEMESEAFRVILGDYVTTDDGTGIVHIAPTFGADDAQVAKAAGVPPMQLVNRKGEFRPMVDLTGKFYLLDELDEDFVKRCVRVDEYRKWEGQFVKNAYDPKKTDKDETLDVALCMELKQRGMAFKIEKHVHNYPHCWRTDKPILYYPLDSWFIRSTAAKERMIELNRTINWKPASTGTGRFGKWLENLNDWNLSRSRYWGTPLPIWRSEDGEETCIGSVEELYAEIEKAVAAGLMASNPLKDRGFVPGDYSQDNYDKIDLHRPFVDEVVLISPTGKPMKRETDLIDVWFDSGAMPYAQIHYPFEHKAELDNRTVYPADFIAEGVDQTRGWFFTLHAISTMVFDSVAYKAVISNGLVLDKNGNKMSKRLGNAVDPFGAIEQYGSDAVRWYMITNSSPWDNLKFDEAGVQEVSRTFFGKLFQTYSFLTMYANVDGWYYAETDVPMSERPEIDRWILSELNTLVKNVEACYEDYEPTKAGRLIQDFVIDNVSNWFVRLSRKRFWGSAMSTDKLSAYQTLYTCLETVARLMAPIAPYYADRLYHDLTAATGRAEAESVHLATFPVCDETKVDKALEYRMELAQQITSMVLSLRKKERIIVRQPLQCISILSGDAERRESIEAVKQLILDEVNVKELQFVEGDGMLVKKVKCNFRTMGKKFGKLMKNVAAAVESLTQEQIAGLEREGTLDVVLEGGEAVTIEVADVEIFSEDIPGWTVANEGSLTVALDITVTDALRVEGTARELVKRIQNLRKEKDFEITDRIAVTLSHAEQTDKAVAEYGDYICGQVLANSLTVADKVDGGVAIDLDDYTVEIKVDKE